MKKRIIAYSLLLLITLLLTGCLKQSVAVEMKKNGKGSVVSTLFVEEQTYQELLKAGNDPFNGEETEVSESDGYTWRSCTERVTCKSYEEIEDALLDLRFRVDLIDDPTLTYGIEPTPIFSEVHVEKESTLFVNTYSFRATINPQSVSTEDYDITEIYKLSLTVDIPGKGHSIEGGTLDDGVATFEIESVAEESTYEVVTTQRRWGMTALVVIMLIAAVVVIIRLPIKRS